MNKYAAKYTYLRKSEYFIVFQKWTIKNKRCISDSVPKKRQFLFQSHKHCEMVNMTGELRESVHFMERTLQMACCSLSGIRIWAVLVKLAIRQANKHFCHFSGRARVSRSPRTIYFSKSIKCHFDDELCCVPTGRSIDSKFKRMRKIARIGRIKTLCLRFIAIFGVAPLVPTSYHQTVSV